MKDVATDRLVKSTKGKFGNRTTYSVQQLISCVKYKSQGCSGLTLDDAWNELNPFNKDFSGY